jgi:hypothetical protein
MTDAKGWSLQAARAEFEKLAALGVSTDMLVEACGRYGRHIGRTGEDPIPPNVWLRDGHWKNWLSA